jgi:hypothetical protein
MGEATVCVECLLAVEQPEAGLRLLAATDHAGRVHPIESLRDSGAVRPRHRQDPAHEVPPIAAPEHEAKVAEDEQHLAAKQPL